MRCFVEDVITYKISAIEITCWRIWWQQRGRKKRGESSLPTHTHSAQDQEGTTSLDSRRKTEKGYRVRKSTTFQPINCLSLHWYQSVQFYSILNAFPYFRAEWWHKIAHLHTVGTEMIIYISATNHGNKNSFNDSTQEIQQIHEWNAHETQCHLSHNLNYIWS